MVLPGPGEVQLIGYDPNLPPARIDPHEEQEINQMAENDLRNSLVNSFETEPEHTYMVTINIQVRAKSPIHAQIEAMNGEHEPIHMSAERI